MSLQPLRMQMKKKSFCAMKKMTFVWADLRPCCTLLRKQESFQHNTASR
ncbi:hypothetical protein HY285_03965 [Candidatus Peregrinibacteria bacterium]|nr:hypothetical protein [Candidatus Peregrinibacteria bacterium]MBI3816671.1 hypothetical protein [Candidatus Peregrinibacteria bacterium]